MSEISDPDLVAAIEHLADPVLRLEQLETQLSQPGVESIAFRHDRIRDARALIMEDIAGRARLLNMKPGTLRLCIELAAKHRVRAGRKISLTQLRRDLDIALSTLRSHRLEAEAELALAQHRAAFAAQSTEAAEAGVDYLERCRS